MTKTPSGGGSNTPHYLILDGLRGVAACAVLVYHLFEAVAFAAGATYQQMYHGFLCVDFFFILSGFVMGHAYDARWQRMGVGRFLAMRIVRLHPMVVMGVLIGLAAYCMQGCVKWDGTQVPMGDLMACVLLSLLILPSTGAVEVRGNTELFPLNGPHWSLFFEYIGSILYAVTLHKLSTRSLAVATLCAAVAMCGWAVGMTDGSIATGWSSDPVIATGGLLRLLYGYPMGLLMARLYRSREAAGGGRGWSMPVCTVALLLLVCVPHLDIPCFDTVFQLLCVGVAFPLLVWHGAGGRVSAPMASATRWLGRLSYPLYAVHYPFIYLYIHWINRGRMPFGWPGWMVAVGLFVWCVGLAAAVTVFYDEPIRRWLQQHLLKKRSEKK